MAIIYLDGPPEPVKPHPVKGMILERAIELRIGDLLRHLKRKNDKVARLSFTLAGMAVIAKLDLRDLAQAVILIELYSEEQGLTHTQEFYLHTNPGRFGGWGATFRCPGLKPKDGLCWKSVRSLYLPPDPGVPRFACRHCHKLEHRSRHTQADRLWSREPLSPRHFSLPVPEEIAEEVWLEELPPDRTREARGKLFNLMTQARSTTLDASWLNRIRVSLDELDKVK